MSTLNPNIERGIMSKGNMEIRKSTREDIKQIMAIFTTAKEYMAAHGNKTQWGDGYPGEEILKRI